MKYLLDTNTCIQVLRHGSGSPVAIRLRATASGESTLCSVVVAELLFGAWRSREVAKNLTDVRVFLADFISLYFDNRAAEEYATAL